MIFHIIRNNPKICLYQEIVQMVLHSNLCKEIFISSGFFQEMGHGQFNASSAMDTHRRSFMNNRYRKNITITTKGVYNYAWYKDYDNFVNDLSLAGYKVNKINSNRHHAKLFLAFNNNIPVLEIIGSTNYTSTAYGINHPKNLFNCEADLVICNNTKLEKCILELIYEKRLNDNVIFLDYNDRNNKNIEEEMVWIKDNLF